MKHHVTRDIPFAWYWKGEPLRKGKFCGERIRPVNVATHDGYTCTSTRGVSQCSSRASLASDRPACSCCEMNHDETCPTTPSSSEQSDCEASNNCSGRSHVPRHAREPEPCHQKDTCRCGLKRTSAGTAGPSCPGCHSPLPAAPETPNYPPHQQRCASPALHVKTSCCEENFSTCYPLPPPRIETPCSHRSTEALRTNIPRAKHIGRRCPSPEIKVRNRRCCHGEDSHSDDSYYTTSYEDDSASETSVEVGPGSDWDADELRCDLYHHCHPAWDCRHGLVCGKM